jgi:sodium transport system permease protein
VDAPRVFRWRWPTGRQALGSLIAAPGLAAAAGLAWLVQQLVFPAPEALATAMEKMFQEALSHWPVTLVALALAPALCEETLFRGFLLSSFDPQKRPWRAILISAALFAVAHLTPYRMAPVFVCGIALGYVALQTRSVVPAMVLHGGLNAIALTFAKYAPGWVESVETLSGWWIIAAVAVAIVGLGGGGRLLTGGRWGLAPDGEDDTSP